ncbi:hypothetical protein [Mesorhizobium hawassense]|uniref:hypothetical protein n=1 Tax=Mesorhizobium hawassense TaxID=1209954 RepID=UPI001FDF089D|nr:hypothetical protein [Mesorhizobium hawassense]
MGDIEDAGIREVLQTPGAAYGAWSILDALLTPTGVGTPFIFREPLGQAREVKVALSGLFGRFVARAYADNAGSENTRDVSLRLEPGRKGQLASHWQSRRITYNLHMCGSQHPNDPRERW